MQRLTENKLIYGNLFEVASPILRERYNRALEALYGRGTSLSHFRIDQSGFSPEVAEELGDSEYLNPHGCNRMFILLTLSQAELPLLDATFSCSRAIFKSFIEDNRATLFALTARDAVIGELEDSVYKIKTLADLTSIKRIQVEVRTPGRLVMKAKELTDKIESFLADDTAWCNDELLQEMIDLAGSVGDVRQQPLTPGKLHYEHGNFYTSHLGGLYVFNQAPRPTLIYCSPDNQASRVYEDDTLGFRHIPLHDDEAIARFLKESNLAEFLPDFRVPDPVVLLAEKRDFIAIDHAARNTAPPALWAGEPRALKRYIHDSFDDLPEDFHALQRVLRTLEQGGAAPRVDLSDPGYFYLLRGAPGPDRDLVNHLLARLTLLDFRQLFICNKELFYEAYESWGDAKRSYVADYLAKQYKGREVEVWQGLFGQGGLPREDSRSEAGRFPEGPWGRRETPQDDEDEDDDDDDDRERRGSSIPESGRKRRPKDGRGHKKGRKYDKYRKRRDD